MISYNFTRTISKWARDYENRLARLISDILTFITQVNIKKIVMWEVLLNNGNWDYFKILILQMIFKSRNPLQMEYYAYLEVMYLFQ